jgi:hypothetical protein
MLTAYAAGFYYGTTIHMDRFFISEQDEKEQRKQFAKEIKTARNELKHKGDRRLFSVAYNQGRLYKLAFKGN